MKEILTKQVQNEWIPYDGSELKDYGVYCLKNLSTSWIDLWDNQNKEWKFISSKARKAHLTGPFTHYKPLFVDAKV